MRLGLGLGLNRITSVLGRIPGYSALVQWFKGTATDGILQDRIGKFPTTERYAGKKFVGDGSAYVDLASTVNLGTSHVIEFEAELLNEVSSVIGQGSVNTNYIISITNNVRYRSGGQNLDFSYSFSAKDVLIFERSGLNVSFSVNGGTPTVLALTSNTDFEFNRLFSASGVNELTGECSYIKFGADENSLHTFPFEMEADSDIMNSIPPTGEEPITGTIINNDGARIVADDSVEQYFNVRGGARAKALGKNKTNVSQYISGFRLDESTGNLLISATSSTSPLILVGNATSFAYSNQSEAYNGLRYAFYKKDRTFISGARPFTNVFSVPFGSYYVRISALTVEQVEEQLEEGTTPTTYEAWKGYHYTNDGLNPVPDGNVGIKTDDGDLNFYLANGDRASVVYHGPVGNDLTECDIAGTPTIGGDYLKAPVDPAIYRVSNATINSITNEWYDDTDPTALTALIVAKSSLTGLKNDSNQQFTRGTGTTIDELATFNAPQTGNTLTRILAYFGL